MARKSAIDQAVSEMNLRMSLDSMHSGDGHDPNDRTDSADTVGDANIMRAMNPIHNHASGSRTASGSIELDVQPRKVASLN
jgi:hypothetical protein